MIIPIMYKHLLKTMALGFVVALMSCDSRGSMVEEGLDNPFGKGAEIKLEPRKSVVVEDVEIELEDVGAASVQDPTMTANLYVMEPENTWGDYLKVGEKLEIFEDMVFEVRTLSKDPTFAVLKRL